MFTCSVARPLSLIDWIWSSQIGLFVKRASKRLFDYAKCPPIKNVCIKRKKDIGTCSFFFLQRDTNRKVQEERVS